MVFLELARAARIGVGGRGVFYSLSFPAMTGTVGVYPNLNSTNCVIFIDFFCDFHYFEYAASSFVSIHLEVPAL